MSCCIQSNQIYEKTNKLRSRNTQLTLECEDNNHQNNGANHTFAIYSLLQSCTHRIRF